MRKNDNELFKATELFKASIELMNQMQPETLAKLFLRATAAVCVSTPAVDAGNVAGTTTPWGAVSSAFTTTEVQQFAAKMKLKVERFYALLEAFGFVVQRAALAQLTPARLATLLMDDALGLRGPQAAALASVWEKEADSVITFIGTRTIGAPDILTGTDWQVHLQVGQKTKSHQMDPVAILQLSLAQHQQKSGDDEPLRIELAPDELSNLFRDLEQVQCQLDALG
jgi:hypothetical protein